METTPTIRRLSTEPFKPEPDDDLIVCRCEEVTKGELRRAVHEGLIVFPRFAASPAAPWDFAKAARVPSW